MTTGATPDAGPAPLRLVPELVSTVDVTVERTVARWEALPSPPGGPAALDWAGLLVGALQHRVEGLCADALRALGWDEPAPPSVFQSLERRALLAEARFLAHYHALQELRDRDEELVASLVLLNGAAVAGDYATAGHRMVGDVDVLVDAEHADRLAARTRELGYWEKEGASGPTYFKDVAAGVPGAGYVGLDVHLAPPTGRPERAEGAARRWADNLVPHVLGDVKVQRATPALELVHLLVRLFEHAASWARWVAEDDLRIVRALDVELVASDLVVPDGAAGVLAHAEALGVTGELAVGLAAVRAVRGRLPDTLAALDGHAAAVEPCTALLALPAGGVTRLEEPLGVRALSVDKSARARALVADGGPVPDAVCRWRGQPPGDRAGLDRIAAEADDLLAKAGLTGTTA